MLKKYPAHPFDNSKSQSKSVSKVNISYNRDNFIIHEEKFYGSVLDNISLNIIYNLNCFQLRNEILSYFQLNDLTSICMDNFGFCYLGYHKCVDKKLIIKPLLCSKSTNNLNKIVKELQILSDRKHENFEVLHDVKFVERGNNRYIWCLYEFNDTVSLNTIANMLNKECLGYKVSCESEFVSLLYSYNSLFDQSKTEYPEFNTIIIHIISQLITAINTLHQQSIIHHAIQPSNIRITLTGVLKLTDFGRINNYKWLHYDSGSCLEPNIDYITKKSPSNRLKLQGSYYYIEPHARAFYTKYKHIKFDNYNNIIKSYHVDYFGLSMVLFELLFGFTYGDITLFDKHSFYHLYEKHDLAFFFPDYFEKLFPPTKINKIHITNFQIYTLKYLKKFIRYNSNGLIEFALNGINSSITRFNDIITVNSNLSQFIDIDKLKQTHRCFKIINFDNLTKKPPISFNELLNKHNDQLRVHDSLKDAIEDIARSQSSLSTNSFSIPVLKCNFKLNTNPIKVPSTNNSSFIKTVEEKNKVCHKNVRKVKTNSFLKLISTCQNNLQTSIKQNHERNGRFEYPNLFFNELLNNIQNNDYSDEFITDRQLHEFMKTQINNKKSINQNTVSKCTTKVIPNEDIDAYKQNILKYKQENSILQDLPLKSSSQHFDKIFNSSSNNTGQTRTLIPSKINYDSANKNSLKLTNEKRKLDFRLAKATKVQIIEDCQIPIRKNNIKESVSNKLNIPLLDSKVVEILSHRQNQRYVKEGLPEIDTLQLSNPKYLYKPLKMTFVRPIRYSEECNVYLSKVDCDIQCNLPSSVVTNEIGIQSIDFTKVKNTEDYEIETDKIDIHDELPATKPLLDENETSIHYDVVKSPLNEPQFNADSNFSTESIVCEALDETDPSNDLNSTSNINSTLEKESNSYCQALGNSVLMYSSLKTNDPIIPNNLMIANVQIGLPIELKQVVYDDNNLDKIDDYDDQSSYHSCNDASIFDTERNLITNMDMFAFRPKLCETSNLEIIDQWLFETIDTDVTDMHINNDPNNMTS